MAVWTGMKMNSGSRDDGDVTEDWALHGVPSLCKAVASIMCLLWSFAVCQYCES